VPEKQWPLRMPVVSAPERFTDCDVVEIHIRLTPMRWHEAYSERRPTDEVHSVVQVMMLEAKDQRAVYYITRQMLDGLMREYLGMGKD